MHLPRHDVPLDMSGSVQSRVLFMEDQDPASNFSPAEWRPNYSIAHHHNYSAGEDVVSSGHYSLSVTNYVLDSYITPGICVIGCLGNVLSLVILSRSRFRQTDGQAESGAHVGLLYIAVSELLLCIAILPRGLLAGMQVMFDTFSFQLLYQAYSTGVISTLILISTWITVDMNLLRYFNICHPFKSRKWNSRRCAMVVYPLSSLLCIALNVPSFYEFEISLFEDIYWIDIGPLGHPDNEGAASAFLGCRVVIAVFIPAIVLIFCNLCLIRALQRSHRMRLQSYVKDNNATRSRKWITVTLVIISLGFIVLVFPSELMDFFSAFIKKNKDRTEAFIIVRSMANSMQVANFALNFVIYCVINVHFRMALADMCRCLLPKPAPANNSQPSSVISAGSMYSSRRLRMSQTRL